MVILSHGCKSQNSLGYKAIISSPCHPILPSPSYFSSFSSFLHCDHHQLQSYDKNASLHRQNSNAKLYPLEMYHLKPTSGRT